MSVYVDNFIKKHKEYFKRNNTFIEKNSWDKDTNNNIESLEQELSGLKESDFENKDSFDKKKIDLRNSLYAEKRELKKRRATYFSQENDITDSIVDRLETFIKRLEKSGDRGNSKAQKFIDFTVKIIVKHINKADDYLNYSDDVSEGSLDDDEDEIDLRSTEIRFQDKVFTEKIKIQDKLESLNISNELKGDDIEFWSGQKATLPMMFVLPSLFPKIKKLTKKLNVPSEPLDKEFLIHKDEDSIPEWNEDKHYWEQDEYTLSFWYSEFLKIKNGLTIDGYFIHPWLYWHLNYYQTPIPDKDGGDVTRNPDLRDNEWFIAEQLKGISVEENPYYTKEGLIIYGSRRIAKALRNDQIIHCEDGEKPIGEARVGEKIYGSDGKLTTIKGVYPQGKVSLHKVILEDGRESICCDEHLWTVFDNQANRFKVLPLKEIISGGYKFGRKRFWKGVEKISTVYQYSIPTTQPVEYPEKNLPIDPYYLGTWLGDGHSRSTYITTMDKKTKQWLKNFAKEEGLIYKELKKERKNKAATITLTTKRGQENPLLNRLKKLEVIDNKHIPEMYLKGSVHQRINLLQGMMDTDGTINQSGGGISFVSANKVLAQDFKKLCLSLGINIKVQELTGDYIKKDGKKNTYTKITMYTDRDVFKLDRKLKRIDKNPTISRENKKFRTNIVDIKPVEKGYATCIRVDNESKEFLTNDYLVTHNSSMMSSITDWRAFVVHNISTAITSGSDGDLGELTHKMKHSSIHMPSAFKIPFQKQEWKNGTVEMGLRKGNTLLEYSRHTIKNLSQGAKTSTQKTAGGAPSVYLVEEIGKFPWEKSYLAALPSFQSDFGFKTIVIAVGCVCAGTKVFRKDGSVVNIEDLNKKDGILGYDGEGVSKESISYLKEPHKKECVRITTRGGHSIECSVDHPFLTSDVKDRERKKTFFKKAEDLRVGDSLYRPEKVNVFGNNSEKDARLIGLLIGDGYYKRSTPSLSIGEDEIYEYVKNNYNVSIKKEFKQKGGKTFREVIISDKVSLMSRVGMQGQSKGDKQIPEIIFKSDEKTVIEFLAGYFDADGNVYYSKSKRVVRIVLTSVNRHLLEGVSILLHKLGIDSTITKEARKKLKKEHPYSGQKPYIHRLYINKVKDVKTFHSKINLLCNHKKENLEKVFDREYSHKSGFLKNSKFKYDKDYGKGLYFKEKNIENVYHQSIISIERIGEKEVYNLTADNTHTYLANGFITHNTGGEASLSGDSVKILANPKQSKFREMDWDLFESKIPESAITWKRRRFGTFMPGQMGYKTGFKRIAQPFGDFLGIDSEALNKITIYKTDWENNTRILLEEREAVKGDPVKSQQEIVQYPIDPEECFMSAEKNIFPFEEARRKKERLLVSGEWDRRRELFKDPMGVIHSEISSKPLAEYPHDGSEIDAPYLIFEDIPEIKPPKYVYIAGGDFYKQESSDTDSVATIYIHKYPLFGDPWGGKLVASLSTRPKTFSKLYERCLLLMEAYNACLFPENEDLGGFQTFLEKKKLAEDFLLPHIDFNTSLDHTVGGRRKWGWTAKQSKQKLLTMYSSHLKEGIKTPNEDGDLVEMKRVETIDDIQLLDEIINYTAEKNVDRITSCMGAVGYLHYLERNNIYPRGYRGNRAPSQDSKPKQKTRKKNFYSASKRNKSFFRGR